LDGRAVVIVDERAVDLGRDIASLYDSWGDVREVDASKARPFDEARLGPPSPHPRQVFAIGMNYKAHAEEAGLPLPAIPATFAKYPTCLTGPFADVALPSANVDWEVELVVVIGRRAERVREADAWSHVAGLTIGQDFSERVVQFSAGGQFSLGKSYPGFGPMGPWLVTPDELDDPDNLALGCSIDGETVQDALTSDMVFSVSQLVAEISAVCPMLPGDVIFTGTPSGIGATRQPARFLKPGETVETWIEGLGRMRNRCVSA
jgi:2-keto-4-pentenoate hydratase/2-oxohepta-3-ene-1,7-dioic acid hydratase in catechol pathway